MKNNTADLSNRGTLQDQVQFTELRVVTRLSAAPRLQPNDLGFEFGD